MSGRGTDQIITTGRAGGLLCPLGAYYQPSLYLDLEGAIRELEREQESASVFLGKIGVGIAKERLEQGDFTRNDTAFLLLDPEDTVRGKYETQSETQCVSLRFSGSHPEAPEYYEKLLRYIQEHHLTVAGFSREITLIDDGLTRHKEEFVTEIQIPIQEE
jgi:effector-binding domain-containing protein